MTTPFVSSSVSTIRPSNINTIDSLIDELRWTQTTISYSFPASNSPLLWSTQPASGYGFQFGEGEPWHTAAKPLTSLDQINFELALQQWANVANINFLKVAETEFEVGDIRVAYSEDTNRFKLAWSYLPGYSVRAGDIWINTLGVLNFEEWDPGSLSFESIMHEIGHVLGLKHPFFDSENPNVAILPENLDNTSHTLMSYTYANLAGQEGYAFSFYPTTPMLLDIAAMQYMYGINGNYHSGDDTYVYTDSQIYHETIWDAGGTDTIQYTGVLSIKIDINAAGASFIGQSVYVQSNAINVGPAVPNVWIAANAVIENATAGQGDDILIGNSGHNVLNGGSGIDTVIVQSSRDRFILNKTSTGHTVTDIIVPNTEDTLIAIERLQFNDSNLALDLEGNAGEVTKLLGAVFGFSAPAKPEYVGLGLAEADKGLSYEQLGELAARAAGLNTSEDIVTTLWTNLFGNVPSEAEKFFYIRQLESGEISTGMLAVLAAESDTNIANINFVNYIQSGIAFI